MPIFFHSEIRIISKFSDVSLGSDFCSKLRKVSRNEYVSFTIHAVLCYKEWLIRNKYSNFEKYKEWVLRFWTLRNKIGKKYQNFFYFLNNYLYFKERVSNILQIRKRSIKKTSNFKEHPVLGICICFL